MRKILYSKRKLRLNQFPQDHHDDQDQLHEVMHLGPPWMGGHSSVEVDAVVKNAVKSHERRNGASNMFKGAQKKEENKEERAGKINVGKELVRERQGWASVLFKRMFRSFCSFPFFIKERSVLSVLFCSL